MKRTIFILILNVFLIYTESKAQINTKEYKDKIDVLYNLSHFGQRILLNYNHYRGRHSLVGGLYCHLNYPVIQPYSRYDDWTFRKEGGFIRRIGFNVGYEYHLLKQYSSFDPYLLIQLQPSFSIDAFEPVTVNQATVKVPRDTFTALETIIGIGFQRIITFNTSINLATGVGPTFLAGTPHPITGESNNAIETSLMLRIGISYQLRD